MIYALHNLGEINFSKIELQDKNRCLRMTQNIVKFVAAIFCIYRYQYGIQSSKCKKKARAIQSD